MFFREYVNSCVVKEEDENNLFSFIRQITDKIFYIFHSSFEIFIQIKCLSISSDRMRTVSNENALPSTLSSNEAHSSKTQALLTLIIN